MQAAADADGNRVHILHRSLNVLSHTGNDPLPPPGTSVQMNCLSLNISISIIVIVILITKLSIYSLDFTNTNIYKYLGVFLANLAPKSNLSPLPTHHN